MQRTALYYLIIVGLAALGLFLILRAGDRTYGQVSPFKASSAIATGQPLPAPDPVSQARINRSVSFKVTFSPNSEAPRGK